MTEHSGLLALLADSALRDEVDRIAAAVGTGVVRLSSPTALGRTAWSAALAVVVDEGGAARCAAMGLPRRRAVFVLAPAEPTATTFHAAMAVGAQSVLMLPAQADELVRALTAALEDGRGEARSGAPGGAVVAVIGGRGGAGASVLAAALALRAPGSLLMDLDSFGGGIDLLLGAESSTGLRWSDIAVRSGRLNWADLRQALPAHGGVTVLSGDRRGFEIDCGAAEVILDAARQGGATVVCDLPRGLTDAAVVALEQADLAAVVCPSDVRSCAATAALAPTLNAVNPNVGLVVRGPSPGGLRAVDVAEIVELPLLAAMRPEPMLSEHLERGGVRLRPRSPLALAATAVLDLLGRRPGRGVGRQPGAAA